MRLKSATELNSESLSLREVFHFKNGGKDNEKSNNNGIVRRGKTFGA